MRVWAMLLLAGCASNEPVPVSAPTVVVRVSTPPEHAGTGFKVTSPGAGLTVFVDGKDRGALPATITDLAPGTYKITIVDVYDDVRMRHYEAFERTITVKADEIVDLGAQKLNVIIGRITFDLATAGAQVFVVSGTERRIVPDKFPLIIEFPASKNYTIEATKAGFDDFKQTLDFSDGQGEKSITIRLNAKGRAVLRP